MGNPMDICPSCNHFLKNIFQEEISGSKWFLYSFKSCIYRCESLGSPKEVLKSSNWCRLCAMITLCFEKKYLEYSRGDRQDFLRDFSSGGSEPIKLKIHQARGSLPSEPRSPSACRINNIHPINGLGIYDLHLYCFSISTLVELRLWADEESPAFLSGSVRDSSLPPDTGSEESLKQIQRWLEFCLRYHPECKTSLSGMSMVEDGPPTLPTRILDVLPGHGGNTVKLVETHGLKAHFVALSHCWGPPDRPPSRTTKDTLAAHMDRIEFHKLSKTFQDAVTTVRSIGLRYLWIDSLCIIQDDLGDWEREAQDMARVYERAQLTLAAISARDSTEGCFFPYQRNDDPVVELPFIGNGEEVANGSFMLTPLREIRLDQEPLRKRCWCFQERYLSRRKVNFTRAGIKWTCRYRSHGLEDTEFDERGGIQDWRKIREEDLDWVHVMERYCASEITNNQDCLIAIQSFAREFGKSRQDTYAAGVWADDLLPLFLWTGDALERNQDICQVPTWSWASVIGKRTFKSFRDHKLLPIFSTVYFGPEKVELEGVLKDGSSPSACPVKFAEQEMCTTITSSSFFFSSSETYILTVPDGETGGRYAGLVKFDLHHCNTFSCFGLGKSARSLFGETLYAVLLLQPDSLKPSTYKRVGIGLVHGMDCFDAETRETVSIE